MIRPTKVETLTGYKIKVSFEDGTKGIVDLHSFIQDGVFTSLKDEATFNKVHVTKSSIAWSDELEIDATAIYLELAQKSPDELLHPLIYGSAN